METTRVISKAKNLYKVFDWQLLDDRGERVVTVAEVHTPIWHEAMALLRYVDEHTSLSMDSQYRFTMEALGIISEQEGNSEDSIREALYNMESDVYTSDLTEWLNESNYHVEYLTEALTEYTPTDGFQLLAMAQGKAKEEAAIAVFDWLLNQEGGEV